MSEASDVPLRVISFAGGGCRAQSSLHILNRVMKEIAIETGQEGQDLRPCDYFQLIGGTSAGGILAIMFGRLGMTVPQCIATFAELAQQVFRNGKRLPWNSKARYRGSNVVEAVKQVLRQQGWAENELLLISSPPGNSHCRTFVTALDRRRVTGNKEPIIFRSYPAPCSDPELQETVDSATIWQAIRATTAAPTYFKPIVIKGVGFLDAAAGGFNDPGLVVQSQAEKIWPGRKIEVFLSLGTGKRNQKGLMDTNILWWWLNLARAIKIILTSNEVTTHLIETSLGQNTFFHFSVDGGVGDVKITNWQMLGKFESLTNTYLENGEITQRIKSLAQKIANPCPLETSNERESIALKIPAAVRETDFPYTAENLPRAYELITKGFETHSSAVEYYNIMLSSIGAGSLHDADISDARWQRYFEFSKQHLGKAFSQLVAEYRMRHKDEAWLEATVLKSKMTQVAGDSMSFQLLDPDQTNQINGEMLEKFSFGRRNHNPNPNYVHGFAPTIRGRTRQAYRHRFRAIPAVIESGGISAQHECTERGGMGTEL